MGDYIVGLTLNWDIKAILRGGFHFSTPDVPYKIKPYKHTYQPRTLPLGCIVSRISFHLAASPPWNHHCERLCYSWVCGYLPAGVGPFLSLTHFSFLLFFFLFSSVLVPAKPFSVYCYSFRLQRAIQRGGSTQNAHTQQLSTAWWDVLPWTNSLQTLPRLPSFTSANNKRRASFPFKFFVRGGFQAMNKNDSSVDLDRCKKNQTNEWW